MIVLPPGAELLAENPSGPQAFRHGRHLGVQFHPEVTPAIIDAWIAGSRDGEVDAARMRADTEREFGRAGRAAAELFGGFIARAIGVRA